MRVRQSCLASAPPTVRSAVWSRPNERPPNVRTSRSVRVLIALALTASLLPVSMSAAAAATTSTACPSDNVPATGFSDTRTSTHRLAIDCAQWWGIVEGRSATSFAPRRDVTRGQAAAMVARLLRTTGHEPSDVEPAGFEDTDGHRFEADIDALASVGIVTGTTSTTFEPDEPVERGQMASILTRTFEGAYGMSLPDGDVPFDDVSADNVHRSAIGRLVASGITTGTTATTFAPFQDVTREQMASFVTRAASVLLVEGVAVLPEPRPAADDAYASRMRAAWVHLFDGTLKTRSSIQALVDELAAADANTIIAQVARRHDAYYDSDVLPRTPDPTVAPGFDVLDTLIELAHAQGLEVHAWYGVAPTDHRVYDDLPAPDGWILSEHGRHAPEGDRWVTRSHNGTWSEYLDPGVPEVQEHVAEVVAELVERYPVDGIHLDYVRYQAADRGYNPRALAAYRADTGESGTPGPGNATWTAWRRDQTRQIILDARDAIDASGRDVTLSAAVISWQDGPVGADRAGFRQTAPYTRTLQDWDRWVREGSLDVVMPMNYFRAHIPEQARWFDQWIAYERALASEGDAEVVPGPGGYLNRPDNAYAQMRAAMGVDGAAMYSYQQPTEDHSRDIWDRLARTRWAYHPVR